MPGITISVFSEPDDYQAALRQDAEIDLLITERGEFRAELTRVALPRLRLSAGTENLARIAVITVASHLVRVSMPVRGQAPLFSGGILSRPGEIVTQGPGHCVFERTAGPCRWRSIWLPVKVFAVYSRAVTGAALDVPPGERRWQPSPGTVSSLTGLHGDAIRLTKAHPVIAAGVQAASGLEQQLIHALIECLLVKPIEEGAAVRGRQAEIMSRFEARIRARANWTHAMPDICSSLGIPDRTLRAYCEDYLGMSPKRYVLLRRLQFTRRALRAADPGVTSVSEIARRYGFDGLGRFAATYHERFGELPSDTLRGAGR
jgi:AraC-like DNA-binding protein